MRDILGSVLHVSLTYNVLRHMCIVFPDYVAKGKRFSWCSTLLVVAFIVVPVVTVVVLVPVVIVVVVVAAVV